MSDSRVKAIRYNMLAGWALELFTLISGLVLPRLVLETFGSEANGLINSVAQYLGFSTILRSGLGGVTRAALYKPLASKNIEQVSAIMVATQAFMRKVAMILVGYILLIALGYPYIAKGSYDWGFMFCMVVIIGTSSVAENLFGIQAKILLQADQKYYIQTLCALITNVLGFVISVAAIKLGASLLFMKFAVMLSSCSGSILLNLYVKNRYKLNMKVKADVLAIKQRWDAFAQQMAIVVNDNIDLFLLTMFVTLKEISVYTVHNMVVLNIRKLVEACVTGINSTFGDMLARNETDTLKKQFANTEKTFFFVCVVIFSVTAIMLTPFVRLYTHGIEDVNYIRPAFAVAMSLAAMMSCMRRPYQMLVEAAGHFKQTRNGAILEVIVNIVASVVLLWLFGIIGVIIGTLIASTIRTIQYAVYSYRNILNLPLWHLLRTYGVFYCTFLFIVGTAVLFGLPEPAGWIGWCLHSAAAVVWTVAVVLIVILINDRAWLKATAYQVMLKLRRK